MPKPIQEQILNAVLKYPVLYDTSHEHFKNKQMTNKIWEEIGEKLQRNPEIVKKKWKNLRDTYGRFLKAQENGDKSKNIYLKWQWGQHMEPFKPYLKFTSIPKTRKRKSILVCSEEDNDTNQSLLQEIPNRNQEIPNQNQEIPNQNQEIPNHHEEILNHNNLVISVDPYQLTEYNQQQSISNVREKRRFRESRCDRTFQDNFKKQKSSPAKDATDMIFLGYAQALKEFSPRRQAEVKIKIATVMAEAELYDQEEKLAQNIRESNYCLDVHDSDYECKPSPN